MKNYPVFIFAALAAIVGLSGCEGTSTPEQASDNTSIAVSDQAEQSEGMPDAAAPAEDKITSPTLGPVSTAASFFVGPGGSVQENSYIQTNFSTINAHLVSDFTPRSVTFDLQSDGIDESYPQADLTISKPGDKEWTSLEKEVVVSGNVHKSYDLDVKTSGKYAIRISYNATTPTQNMTPRPVLQVKQIKLEQ